MSTNKEAADAVKAFKDVEATHKAHKEAAQAVHNLKKTSSKDAVLGAVKDLADAHKAHKEACEAHLEACKAIVKEDRAKMDLGELRKADIATMREHLAEQDRARILGVPMQKAPAPAGPLSAIKKALRNPLPL